MVRLVAGGSGSLFIFAGVVGGDCLMLWTACAGCSRLVVWGHLLNMNNGDGPRVSLALRQRSDGCLIDQVSSSGSLSR
jgi:hypothetical protein